MQMKPPPPRAEHSCSPLIQTFSTKESKHVDQTASPHKYHKVDATPFWDTQHCRLTLWKNDSWNRRNSHHYQRVVLLSSSIRTKNPNNNPDTEKGTLSILGMPYLVLAL